MGKRTASALLWFLVGTGFLASGAEPEDVPQAIHRYLVQKVGGTTPMSQVPGASPIGWCQKQYDAAAKTKDPKVLYRLVDSHLLRAGELFKSKKKEDHYTAFGMVIAVELCCADKLKDKWLTGAVADGYLMANLGLAHESEQNYLGRQNLITYAIAFYGQSGEDLKYIKGYKALLEIAISRSDDNSADAARLKLGEALLKQGELQEALEYLQAVDPRGSLSTGAAQLAAKVRKAIEAKKSK
jgi:hypothetical protein